MTPYKKPPIEVKVGQVWQDNDKRGGDRFIRVETIEGEKATCRRVVPVFTTKSWQYAGLPATRIKLTRFRPNSTGYFLADVEGKLAIA